MKLCAKFTFGLALVYCALAGVVWSSESSYFSQSSCPSREPESSASLAAGPGESPFELVVHKRSYVLNGEKEPFVVSIVRRPTLVVEQNSALVDESVQIEGFFLQALQGGRPIGAWKTDYGSMKTLPCLHAGDTVVLENANVGGDIIDLQWKLESGQSIDKDAPITFVGTIVGSNKSYWKNVESSEVTIRYSDELELSVDDFVITNEMNDNTPRDNNGPNNEAILSDSSVSKTKRNVQKQFAMSTSQCGGRKSCYVSLKTCDTEPKTCTFVLSWDYDGELVNYELTGLATKWISVVFSQDQNLGNDNVVACMKEFNTENIEIVQYFKSSSDEKLTALFGPNDNLLNKNGVYNPDGGYIYCKFSRPKVSKNPLITNLSAPHYIFIERGSGDEMIGPKLSLGFQPSDTKIDFADTVYVATSPRSWLVKVHAILGIIAWILLGSIGIMMARYYKPLWPNHFIHSYRVWFTFHRPLMVFVTLLSLLSFLFALIELEWTWSVDGHDLLHAILGIIVIICSLINPILGVLRPRPDSPLRCCFFWCHWLVGTIAYCLAIPTIFIGMDLRKSDLPNWCAWLLFAWVLFHIIVEIVLEVHYCCTFYQYQGNFNEYNDLDKNRIPLKKKNPPGYRWKPTLLFFYAIITAIVVSILVIAIVLFDI